MRALAGASLLENASGAFFAEFLVQAFDEAVDWLVDNAPGLLADEEFGEAYNEAIVEGKSEDQECQAREGLGPCECELRAKEDIVGNAGVDPPSRQLHVHAANGPITSVESHGLEDDPVFAERKGGIVALRKSASVPSLGIGRACDHHPQRVGDALNS